MKKLNFAKYGFEFLSIFIAVLSAFALNNWNDNRKDSISESKILVEISNGLGKDLEDITVNVGGHKAGIRACEFWRKVLENEEVTFDSLKQFYFDFSRDYISIQNISGYETLKSKGLELIEDDSLRLKIISVYEYDYSILRKFEEEYKENQFHESYFKALNDVFAPNFTFDEKGDISGMNVPINIPKSERKILLSYLWKIKTNRNFILYFYNQVEGNVKELKGLIEEELE